MSATMRHTSKDVLFAFLGRHAVNGVVDTIKTPEIAERIGVRLDTVQGAIQRLRETGQIEVTHRYRDGLPNIFRIIEDPPPAPPVVSRYSQPADIKQRVRELWATGLSTAKIGEQVGTTKNAVIGMAHRMNLSGRNSPIVPRGEPKPAPGPRVVRSTIPKVASEQKAPPAAPVKLPLPSAGYGPMRYNFRSTRPVVSIVPKPEPIRRTWVADDGSATTGPSLRPCQFVVRDGSTANPFGWIFCGMSAPLGSAWCGEHFGVVYTRAPVRQRVAA